jgi:hypothetical protein
MEHLEMQSSERAAIRAQLNLDHYHMGLVTGFPPATAKVNSERREFTTGSQRGVGIGPSEAVLLRLLRDGVVTVKQCLERSDEPAAHDAAKRV